MEFLAEPSSENRYCRRGGDACESTKMPFQFVPGHASPPVQSEVRRPRDASVRTELAKLLVSASIRAASVACADVVETGLVCPLDELPDAAGPSVVGVVEPVDVEPVDVEPVDVEPVEVEPVEVEPVEVEPVDVEPVDVEPVDVEPVDEEPVDVELEALDVDELVPWPGAEGAVGGTAVDAAVVVAAIGMGTVVLRTGPGASG